jgi:hypothetical protein
VRLDGVATFDERLEDHVLGARVLVRIDDQRACDAATLPSRRPHPFLERFTRFFERRHRPCMLRHVRGLSQPHPGHW